MISFVILDFNQTIANSCYYQWLIFFVAIFSIGFIQYTRKENVTEFKKKAKPQRSLANLISKSHFFMFFFQSDLSRVKYSLSPVSHGPP